jgi:hypothetical protein
MLSINECKKILNQKEQKYTTEQINEIRDSLNKLAEIIYLEKTINNEKTNRKESGSLQKS